MIFSAVQSFVEAKFRELNSRKSDEVKVRRIENDLEFSQISASQADIHYQLYLAGVEATEDIEAEGFFNANVRIDFTFNIAGKDYTAYRDKFDNYVYLLFNLLEYSPDALGDEYDNIGLNECTSVSVTNADRFEEDYYRPTINFVLKGFDNSVAGYVYGSENSII